MSKRMENLKIKKNYLKEDLKVCDIEINAFKKELKFYTNQLLSHYHQLLNEGTDTRYF
mgnify:CR=1 FL=1